MRAAVIYDTTGKIVVQHKTQPATVYICFIFDKKDLSPKGQVFHALYQNALVGSTTYLSIRILIRSISASRPPR